MKSPSPLTKSALCLFLACAWSGCDRKQPETAAQAPGSGAPPAAAAPANSLVANAPRLGMAGRLPKDTAFYLGSASLKDHREALEKTQYWKTVKAYMQDKKPSAEKQAKKAKAMQAKLEGVEIDDFFLAMSKESNASLSWLIDLNRVYSEYTYRTLMTGFTGGGASGSSFDPQAILANASASPELIESLCSLLERATLPHLIMGLKTAQAEELMKEMFPADPEGGPEWTADLKKGTLTANTGATFTTYEGTVGIWLTPAKREELLAGLGKTVKQPELLARIKQTLDTLATKTFSFGVGVSEGYLITAVGNDLKHLQFAATPAESLLARPDLAAAVPQAGKNLLGLVHIDAETITAVHDDQPLSPMLQAALSGLGATPVFSALTQQLEPKVASLATAEKDFYKYTFAPLNGALWWDEGLHMAMTGGVTPEGMILDKPLQFGSLLSAPDLVFAAVGHSPVSVTGRAYFERWMDLLYTAAGGFVQAGLGGEQAQAMYGLADKAVIPPLVKIYEASKTLYQKGVGTESAMVIDLKGQTPLLPPAEGAEGSGTPIPRLTAVHTVQDRKAIADAWKVMEGNLNQILQSLPTPMPPMAPMSSEKAGMTTWFFPLAPGGNDLLPCVTLNDKIFMFGTSMNQHHELAEKLSQPASPAAALLTGSHYRFSFAPIRGLLKNASALPVPGVPAEEVTTALPFIAPFGDLRGRAWVEGGQLHNTFHLEAKDVRQVD